MASRNVRFLRQNATDAERVLWRRIRLRQLDGRRFRRQAPIGPFIVDFVCFDQKLVIELDGGQHAIQMEADNQRTLWLESQGFLVLRFWNGDVLRNTDGVLHMVRNAVQIGTPDHVLK